MSRQVLAGTSSFDGARPDRCSRLARSALTCLLLVVPLAFNASTRVWADSGGLRSAAALAASCALAAGLMLLPGVAVLALVERRGAIGGLAMRVCLAVVGAGTAHWAVFWLWVLSPVAGRAAAVVGWSVTAVALAWRRPTPTARLRPVVSVLALAPCVAVASIAVLTMHGGLAFAPDVAAGSTYHTADNMFPQQWAQRVDDDADLREAALGWPLVERPPAQAAWVLPGFSLAANEAFAYQALSVSLSGLGVSAMALLLLAVGLRGWSLVGALGLASLTVFTWFNLVFTMPKMLTGTLLVLVVAALLQERDGARPIGWAAIGGALALSAVAHSGGLLALPALAVIVIARRAWPTTQAAVAALVAGGAAVAGPWIVYQLAYHQTTSAIAKWHLAGVTDESDTRSLLRAILDEYRLLGVGGAVRQRLENLWIFVGGDHWSASTSRGSSLRDRWLAAASLAPAWSAGILILFLPVVARWRRMAPDVRVVLLAAGTAFAVWIGVEFGPPSAILTTVNGPFASYLLLSAGIAAAVASVVPPRVLGALVAIQAGLLAWTIAPLGATDGCARSMMCMPRDYQSTWIGSDVVIVELAILAAIALACATAVAHHVASDASTRPGLPSTSPPAGPGDRPRHPARAPRWRGGHRRRAGRRPPRT